MKERGEGKRARMRSFARPALQTMKFSWHRVRFEFVSLSLLATLRALLPAVQVLLVQRLTVAVGSSQHDDVLPMVFATALAVGLTAGLADVESAVWKSTQVAIRSRMSAELVERMACLTSSQIADPQWSARSQEARDSIQQHAAYHLNAIIGSFTGAVSAAGLVTALWSTSPTAALLILASLLPLIVSYLLVSHGEEELFRQRSRFERSARYLQDQLTYQRTAAELISLGSAQRVAAWFARSMEQIRTVQSAIARRQTIIVLCGGMVTTLALAAALYVVSLGPTATLGGAAGGIVAVLSATAVVRNMGYSLGALMAGSGPVAHYFDFLNSIQPRHASQSIAPPKAHELVLDNVTYCYPGSHEAAVVGVHFRASRGELVALVGVNGAGKTTVVNLLRGSILPEAGAVLVDERDMSGLCEADRLSLFAHLTQEFGRYELTVRETVSLGSVADDVADDRLWDALALARAADFVRRLPAGLDTQLGQQWGGVGLSGGQWQRLALARVVLRNAPVWLLDEPTSAVDAETEQDIFDLLGDVRHERITIVVSHRASTLRGMDRIYVLDHGEVVQVGTYAELMAETGRFRQLFARQVDVTGTRPHETCGQDNSAESAWDLNPGPAAAGS